MSSSSHATARAAQLLRHLSPHPTSGSSGGINNGSTTYEGPFAYSLDPKGLLTEEQRKFYDENGYILIKKLVPEKDIERWRQRFLAIANGEVEVEPTMLVMRDVAVAKRKEKGEHAITKLQDFQDDPELFSYCQHPDVARYVEAIIGSDFKSVHSMLINKPPDVGLGSSRHPPHQDLWYFPFRPAHRIVASWTAMQKIDRENGGLFVQPGSHKGQLFKHTYPDDGIVNKAYHGIQNMSEKDGERMLHVEMDVGDTLFFHPLLVHGSGRNNSTRFRKAISCHYAATSCHYEDVSGSIQEDIAKEIEAMAARKGVQLTFNDVWRLKSRLIQGKEGTL